MGSDYFGLIGSTPGAVQAPSSIGWRGQFIRRVTGRGRPGSAKCRENEIEQTRRRADAIALNCRENGVLENECTSEHARNCAMPGGTLDQREDQPFPEPFLSSRSRPW